MSIPSGLPFWKMSGSGNDFVFLDGRGASMFDISPARVRELCASGTGVGADGVVVLQNAAAQDFAIRYFNRDGSLGELCGNASMCSVRLARELNLIGDGECRFHTDAGIIVGRFQGGQPSIDLQPATELQPNIGFDLAPGERRMGFANTGVPHLVVLVDDTESVDVVGRGRPLRLDRRLKAGANVNFVMPSGSPGDFVIRTYERGVEAETLACGTGAVASAILLEAWGLSGSETRLRTRSGRTLTVQVRHEGEAVRPTLSGEARVVFTGVLAEI